MTAEDTDYRNKVKEEVAFSTWEGKVKDSEGRSVTDVRIPFDQWNGLQLEASEVLPPSWGGTPLHPSTKN